MTHFREHILRASELLGTQERLADAIGRGQSYISFLLKEAKTVNPAVALEIEKATDGKVSRFDLRPDIFGEPPAGQVLAEPQSVQEQSA